MSLFRTAGAAGTNQEGNRCPQSGAGGVDACSSAFLCLHLTPQSTAYLEVSWLKNREVTWSLPFDRELGCGSLTMTWISLAKVKLQCTLAGAYYRSRKVRCG
jgi:hypothetical protein